jgi:hypothetical protein
LGIKDFAVTPSDSKAGCLRDRMFVFVKRRLFQTTMILLNSQGGYSFLRGAKPYSGGVVAANGYAIESVRLSKPVPWKLGFELVDGHLSAMGRPRAALCAIALRSPAAFTFQGFKDFNNGYVDVLKSWNILVDGINPIARTNVAPELDPPAEPSLYSFAYTVPAEHGTTSFVVAGGGELPDGSFDPADIICANETSPDAMRCKADFVLGLMEGRLHGLGVSWGQVTVTNIYTVHDVNALLAGVVLPRIGTAARHGVTWHYTRPPIVGIEYEMDVRGGTRESLLEVS